MRRWVHDSNTGERLLFTHDSPEFAWCYDDTALAPESIADRLTRYDPELFLRYNRESKAWELWRFRARSLVKPVAELTVQELYQRCVFWFEIATEYGVPLPLDEAMIMENVYSADEWRRSGLSARDWVELMAQRDKELVDKHLQKDKDTVRDYIIDHKHQLYPLKHAHDGTHIRDTVGMIPTTPKKP